MMKGKGGGGIGKLFGGIGKLFGGLFGGKPSPPPMAVVRPPAMPVIPTLPPPPASASSSGGSSSVRETRSVTDAERRSTAAPPAPTRSLDTGKMARLGRYASGKWLQNLKR